MQDGPWKGRNFSYYGAHAMEQEDGTIVLGWSEVEVPFTHGHTFTFTPNGKLIRTESSGYCNLKCYYWPWRELP